MGHPNSRKSIVLSYISSIPCSPSQISSFLPVSCHKSPFGGRVFLFAFPYSSSCFHSLWSAKLVEMRAFLVLSSLVLNVALAAPSDEIRKRDVVTIQNAIVTVSTAASNLDIAIRVSPFSSSYILTNPTDVPSQTLSTDPRSAEPLVPAVMDIEFALTQARTDILPTQSISIAEAVNLQTAADTLTKSLKIMVMSSMLQRQALDQLGMTPMLLMSFMNQNMLSAALSQAIVSKVPAEGISNAAFALGGARGAVNMGILSLSNAPLVMPANMTPPPPPAAPQQPAPPPAPENPQQPPPQQPPPQQPAPPAAGATATGQGQGQGQGQAAPQENPASSAITADTNKTAS